MFPLTPHRQGHGLRGRGGRPKTVIQTQKGKCTLSHIWDILIIIVISIIVSISIVVVVINVNANIFYN